MFVQSVCPSKSFCHFLFISPRRPLGESNLQFKCMERNLRRLKNQKYPCKPKTASEIRKLFENANIKEKFGMNLRKTNNFYINTIQYDENNAFCLFASYQIMSLIEKHITPEHRTYMVDGTFSATPGDYFYQLLIITITFKNDVCFYRDMFSNNYTEVFHLMFLDFSCILRTHDK